MRRMLWLFAVALTARAQILKAPVVAVDFYGAAQVDFERLRAALPVRVGESLDAETAAGQDTGAEFLKLVGDNRWSLSPVFVPDLKGWVVYVDVEPPGAASHRFRPEPSGAEQLPAEIVALYEHAMDRYVNGGIEAGEETAEGYSLSKDPAMRADELQLIHYARKHAAKVYRVLETSASPRDRIAAAWIAGYAPQTNQQTAALLRGVDDPNGNVRNNVVRVLGVLAEHDTSMARRIPAEPFLPMLHSLTWTDRNKAMFVLGAVTAARDPKTLATLRRDAIGPLRQMSKWTNWGHAAAALTLLGRASGMAEERLQALLAAENARAILEEAR